MDKKDLENLSVSELLKLKESINDEIEKKRTQQTLSTARSVRRHQNVKCPRSEIVFTYYYRPL